MANDPSPSNGREETDGTSGPPSSGYEPPQWFWQTRIKGPSRLGALVFTGLRTIDVPLQYWLLKYVAESPASTLTTTHLGLGLYQSLVTLLPVGASLKQIYWNHAINAERFPAPFAAMVGAYNSVFNGLNTVLSVWRYTSQSPSDQSSYGSFARTMPLSIPTGLILFSVGLFVEWYSEVQRKRFKSDPRNTGKPYSDGLFGLARNINYGGYTLWRTGYALICGGWVWAGLVLAWNAGDFCSRAIPSMDAYCERRYKQQWEEVRDKVPYKLLPWIY